MRSEKLPRPESFEYEESGGIATITFNRAERLNALTFTVYAELRDLFAALEHRPEVRAIIVTGRGKGFCSGGDVEEIIGPLLSYDAAQLLAFTRMTGALVNNMRRLPRPIVAALNGIAAGAGAVIALAADFRIGTDRSSLAFLFTKVGLAGADMGAAWLLPRIVGLAKATEILFLGDKIGADDALRLGLLNRIVAGDDLMVEARRLAERLASGPAFAIGMTKTLLNEELAMSLPQGIEAEAQAQALCMQTPNFAEAYRAFVEKRPPRFS
jgi:enoyl-CoA hydratase/carnithine racemase